MDKETRKKLQENRQKAKGDWKKIAELDRQALFGHNRLARVASWVFIDIDNKDEHALGKLVKYLRKMGIYPEVWETQKGYHVYIYFYYSKEYQYVKVEDEDGETRVEKVFVGYILPYASNYKIGDVEKALKHLCSKLGIEADIVSAKHSVWMEGVPNPIKGGFATKLLRKGYPLSLEDLWQKMLNILVPLFYRKPRNKPKPENTDTEEEALRELDRLLGGQHSNAFFALNQYGTLKACRQLWKAGYDLFDIEFELRKRLDIRNSSDEKALQNFLDYFSTHYTDIERPYVRHHEKKERRHEHYYEFAEQVKEALEKGYLKVADIARYLGCARHKVENLQRFLRKHGYDLVDLLHRYEEVMAFLKEHAKGGNKWHKKDKEAWLAEMQQKKAEYIQRCKEEAEKRRAKKRAELEARGIDPDRWRQAPVLCLSIPYIGHQVYDRKVVDGFTLTNRPFPSSKKQRSSSPRTGRQLTPAVPLVILSKHYSTKLRDALFRAGSYSESMTKTVYLQEHLRDLKTQKPKREPKKLRLPPSRVIEDVVRFFEGRRSQVSRQELEIAIYNAWQKVDKDKADRLAVSRYIDRFEGVLWRKLNNEQYSLLVSSNKVRVRIRDYVLELERAKKNGQGQTSADGNGSVGSDTNGQEQPHTNGNGSLGFTYLSANGNGKYDIDHIIHTLEEKGSVVVPPQWVQEIVRELGRRGFSVKYYPVTGLIELVGRDDELPF